MRGQYLTIGAILFLSGCDAKPEGQSPTETAASSNNSVVAADASLSTAAPAPGGPTLPDDATRRAAIDREVKSAWRETPYSITDIKYQDEKAHAIGQSGGQYEAIVSVTLTFPQGWLTNCIGPNPPWGCSVVDRNVMQIQTDDKPIPAGESRTFTGRLTMSRTNNAGGKWESRDGTWQQVESNWESGGVAWKGTSSFDMR